MSWGPAGRSPGADRASRSRPAGDGSRRRDRRDRGKPPGAYERRREITVGRREQAVDDLALAYPRTPPADLLARVRGYLDYTSGLLDGRVTLGEHRRILVSAGWLSLLSATCLIDLRRFGAATAYLRTAAQLSRDTGHAEIAAWCLETKAWQITSGEYRRAAELAGGRRRSSTCSTIGESLRRGSSGRRSTSSVPRPGGRRRGNGLTNCTPGIIPARERDSEKAHLRWRERSGGPVPPSALCAPAGSGAGRTWEFFVL